MSHDQKKTSKNILKTENKEDKKEKTNADDSDNKTQSQVKPIKSDKDTKRMVMSKKNWWFQESNRLKLKGTQVM